MTTNYPKMGMEPSPETSSMSNIGLPETVDYIWYIVGETLVMQDISRSSPNRVQNPRKQ